jgi:5-methylcytosine-specific restriction endonuclease McrA
MSEKVEGLDYVVCQICGKHFRQISQSHLNKHNITFSEYVKKYPNAQTILDSVRDKIRDNHADFNGENNPNFGLKRSDESRERSSNAASKRYEDPKEHDKTSKSLIGKCPTPSGKDNCGFKMEVGVVCEWCGDIFDVKPGKVDKRRFCSNKCADKANIGHESYQTLESRIKLSCTQRGISIEDFDGFITPEHEKLRKSPEYAQWRTTIFKRDNYTCQQCGRRGGIYLNCHHILPYRDYPEPEYSLNPDNGITLCVECHRETFGKEYDFMSTYLGKIFDDKAAKIWN